MEPPGITQVSQTLGQNIPHENSPNFVVSILKRIWEAVKSLFQWIGSFFGSKPTEELQTRKLDFFQSKEARFPLCCNKMNSLIKEGKSGEEVFSLALEEFPDLKGHFKKVKAEGYSTIKLNSGQDLSFRGIPHYLSALLNCRDNALLSGAFVILGKETTAKAILVLYFPETKVLKVYPTAYHHGQENPATLSAIGCKIIKDHQALAEEYFEVNLFEVLKSQI